MGAQSVQYLDRAGVGGEDAAQILVAMRRFVEFTASLLGSPVLNMAGIEFATN